MHQPNSSTFNSKSFAETYRLYKAQGKNVVVRSIVSTMLWTALFIVAADVGINVIFAYPSNANFRPSAMQAYFNYGRSIESKLRSMVRDTDAESDTLSSVGWIGTTCQKGAPNSAAKIGVSIYGMSFSNHIGSAMREIDPTIAANLYSAPAAPPNHSYACFLKVNKQSADHNPVQVLSILSSSVKGILSLTGSTMSFERPPSYTFPRYIAGESNTLTEIAPDIQSIDDLRKALSSDVLWERHIDQLSKYDIYYDSWLMKHNILDKSAIFRMLRRAYAQNQPKIVSNLKNQTQNLNDIDRTLTSIVLNFAQRCRMANQIPIVLFIHDPFEAMKVDKHLVPMLASHNIDFFSTNDIAPVSDASNFLGDGHFTPIINEKIAKEFSGFIKSVYSKKHLDVLSR